MFRVCALCQTMNYEAFNRIGGFYKFGTLPRNHYILQSVFVIIMHRWFLSAVCFLFVVWKAVSGDDGNPALPQYINKVLAEIQAQSPPTEINPELSR